MDGLDDVDREILALLLEDGRRPFSDIAERVDLSAPAVSDRVDRLQERGLIRGFTVDVDWSMLRRGQPVLATLKVRPGQGERVQRTLAEREVVEHVFRTVDDRVVVNATVPDGDVGTLLADAGVLDQTDEYDVRLQADVDWTPTLGAAELAPTCAECGNTVDDEGTSVRLDGDEYFFCCGSCEDNFVSQYEQLREGA